jgi:hypothetical protein
MIRFSRYFSIFFLYFITVAMTIMTADSAANVGGTALNGNGDRTGSPIASGTCAVCHSGGSYGTVAAVITVTDVMGAPVTAFVAGETYMIAVEVTHTSGSPGGYGFQLTLLDSNNDYLGAFSVPSAGSGLFGPNNQGFWESNTSNVTNSFTVLWDAPAVNTTVGIYVSGLAVNVNGSTSGDSSSLGESFSAELSIPAEWIFANGFE